MQSSTFSLHFWILNIQHNKPEIEFYILGGWSVNAQSSGQTTPNPTQAPLDQLAAPKNSADITIPKIKFISNTQKDGHSSF